MPDINEEQVREIIDCVLGLETDDDSLNSQLGVIATSAPVEWYCALCWQFSFLAATGFSIRGIHSDTDDEVRSTLEKVAKGVIPKLTVVRSRRTLGIIIQKRALSNQEIASEFDEILNDFQDELKHQFGLLVAGKPVGKPVAFSLRDDEPLCGIIAVAIEKVYCKRLGFVQGAAMSAHLYSMAQLFARG